MAQIKQGILGGFSGSVGSVTGSSWKGIATMRAKPLSVFNPKTTAQVENRTRFSNVTAFATSILSSTIKPLNDRFASGMSGYNLFTSRNKGIFDAAGAFVPANVVLSRGKLGDDVILSAMRGDDNIIDITFSPTPVGAYQSATDKMYCVVADVNGNVLGASSGIEMRSNEGLSVNLSVDLTVGQVVKIYLASLRADGTMCSNSGYLSAAV